MFSLDIYFSKGLLSLLSFPGFSVLDLQIGSNLPSSPDMLKVEY